MPKIELTDAQRQAIQADPGRPVDVVDPATQQRYVLLAREQYDHVGPLLEQHSPPAAPEPPASIAPEMLRSMQAYWRELPELLKCKSKARRWVAFHGDDRVGFGKSQTELYQECLRRGWQRGEFYVGRLEADPEGIPPWGTLEGEWSLFEVGEADEGAPTPDGQ
jgi:hypothetical protein